ncbi:MAG: CinA family protein [Treponema sp.]|jgi:PncC family amidohydrolase|nr:CinA family protein [Treponema sp.]
MAEAETLIKELLAQNKKAVAAESCTAGLVADLIASVPGASEVFWGSLVTYTQDAKIKLLGVREGTLKTFGAVSRETACEMAQGALERSGCYYAAAVTGIAGPGGDGTDAAAGTVYIALASQGGKGQDFLFHFDGSRNEVRRLAALKVLQEFLSFIRAGGLPA